MWEPEYRGAAEHAAHAAAAQHVADGMSALSTEVAVLRARAEALLAQAITATGQTSVMAGQQAVRFTAAARDTLSDAVRQLDRAAADMIAYRDGF